MALSKRLTLQQWKKGFWESDRDIFESANLINTEVAEMVEELRSGHEVEEIYFNLKIPTKPEGFPVELADYAIRCADLAGAFWVVNLAVIANFLLILFLATNLKVDCRRLFLVLLSQSLRLLSAKSPTRRIQLFYRLF